MDHLKTMIKEKKLQPGDKMPSESQLTEMFGVSRTPVREALSVLEASGLIASKQGGGSVIQAASLSNVMEEIQFDFVDPHDILTLLETRLIIETGAAQLAAERRTSGDLAIMRKTFEKVQESYIANEIGHQEDIAFHKAIATAAHNPLLLKTMENMSDLYAKSVKFSLVKNIGQLGKREQVLDEHERIFMAIEQGDAKQAQQLMHLHLTNAKQKFETELKKISS
nr:FadR/GntR family transcriptional regulator [Bacillus piscicola]